MPTTTPRPRLPPALKLPPQPPSERPLCGLATTRAAPLARPPVRLQNTGVEGRGGGGGLCIFVLVCSSGPSVATVLSRDARAGPAHQARVPWPLSVRARSGLCIRIQMNTKLYSYKRASLINIWTISGGRDASGLPRQPIRAAGELGGTRGDELVSGINNRVLIQIYYKSYVGCWSRTD